MMWKIDSWVYNRRKTGEEMTEQIFLSAIAKTLSGFFRALAPPPGLG